MLRVPRDPDAPTFDDTFKVGLGRWLTSSGADRREWARRRNAAARLAGANQRRRHTPTARPVPPAAHRVVPAPVAMDPAVAANMRNVNRLTTAAMWVTGFQLAGYALAGVLLLAAVGVVIWMFVAL